jgi:hypothetical protein
MCNYSNLLWEEQMKEIVCVCCVGCFGEFTVYVGYVRNRLISEKHAMSGENRE